MARHPPARKSANKRPARLFAQACRFLRAVSIADDLPAADRCEVAFAGRSNVGKSSLINALAGQKDLARTSNTPGRTQSLNFYAQGTQLYLVDLPGYGYARAPGVERERWGALIEHYLEHRTSLQRVLILLDARRGFMSSDRELMAALESFGLPFQLVLTKTDMLKPPARAPLAAEISAEVAQYPACLTDVVTTSAITGEGIDHLRHALALLAEGKDARYKA